MEKEMIIGMAITSAITFALAFIILTLAQRYHWRRKVLRWYIKSSLWIKKRTLWNRLMEKGLNLKVGSFELEIHPRDNRPKLYIQRYGKRD